MDPLSLTMGCTGLLSSIADLYRLVNGFVRDVRDSRRDIDALRSELTLIQCCVELLQDDATSGDFQIPSSLQSSLVDVLSKCKGIVLDMVNILSRMNSNTFAKRVQWAASGKDDINRLRVRLGDYKSSLDIALEIATFSISKSLQMEIADVKRETIQIDAKATEIKTEVVGIKTNTEAIMKNTNGLHQMQENVVLILQKISALQIELPPQQQEISDQPFTLQRFLDESTQYARSIYPDYEPGDDATLAGFQRSSETEPERKQKRRAMIREFLHDDEKLALDRALLDYVRDSKDNCEMAKINSWLDLGADVNTCSEGGFNAVSTSIAEGSTSVAETMITDCTLTRTTLQLLLLVAVLFNFVGMVQMLLEKGADMMEDREETLPPLANSRGDVGRRGVPGRRVYIDSHDMICEVAVKVAMKLDDLSMFALMIKKGAHLNTNGQLSSILLYHGIRYGHLNMIGLLLQNKADVNARNKNDESMLHLAIFHNHVGVVDLLLAQGVDVNAQVGTYGNPLQTACSKGHYDIAMLLLHRGADVNSNNFDLCVALETVSSSENVDFARLLLNKGADNNVRGGKYGNALQAAASAGRTNMVHLLLDHGADPNADGGEYGNAFYRAASGGRADIIKLLLRYGADPNPDGGKHSDALYRAVSSGSADTVQLLLDHSADPNRNDREYSNALQVAVSAGRADIVQLLLNHDTEPNTNDRRYSSALYRAAFSGSTDIVQLLLDHGGDPNANDGRYGNALYGAAFSGSIDMVQILLNYGADPNRNDGEYYHTLRMAVSARRADIAQLLLDHGADPNPKDGGYSSPLYKAAFSGSTDMVQILLDHGAEPNANDRRYRTALQEAQIMSRGCAGVMLKLFRDTIKILQKETPEVGNTKEITAHRSARQEENGLRIEESA